MFNPIQCVASRFADPCETTCTESLIAVLRRIKLDPNPLGEENFLFINALNEWGEGNVLEPTKQWGDRFSQALRGAVDYADQALPWLDEVIREGEELEAEVLDADSQVDVCVIVQDSLGRMPWTDVWQLSTLLRSLQAQRNPRWRAVVVPGSKEANMAGINAQVMDASDPRIKAHEIPQELKDRHDSDNVTDWVIQEIDTLSPSCGSASYMLVTDATWTYDPYAFDAASEQKSDIIGLNFMSQERMKQLNIRGGGLAWDDRCSRFLEPASLELCPVMSPGQGVKDLSAALINQHRWREEGHVFGDTARTSNDSAEVLVKLEQRSEDPWKWSSLISARCDVVQSDTYLSCIRTGHMWFDAPDEGGFDSGCYSGVTLRNKFGSEITTTWDYKRFKEEDPFCVRLSMQKYESVLSETVERSSAVDEDDDS